MLDPPSLEQTTDQDGASRLAPQRASHGRADAARARGQLAPGDAPLRAELLSADRLADEARALAAAQDSTTGGRIRATPLIALAERAAASLGGRQPRARDGRARAGCDAARRRVAARQLLPHRRAGPPRSRGPAGRTTASSCRGSSAATFAGFPRIYEARARAHRAHRLAPRRGVPRALRRRLPGGLAAHDRRGVGGPDHAAHRRWSRTCGASPARSSTSQRAELAADVWAERLVLAAQDATRGAAGASRRAGASRLAGRRRRSSCGSCSGSASWRRGGEAINAWLEHRLSAEGIVLETAAAAGAAGAGRQPGLDRQRDHEHPLPRRARLARVLRARLASSRPRCAGTPRGPTRRWTSRAATATATRSRRWRGARDYSEIGVAETIRRARRRGARGDASDDRARPRRLVAHRRGPLRARADTSATGRRSASASTAARSCAAAGSSTGARSPCSARALLALLGVYASSEGAAAWQIAAAAACSAIVPASELALVIVNRLASLVFPPKRLAKLDFRRPIDESHRTLVVIPALLSSVGLDPRGHRAPRDHLPREPRPQLAFALLGDLRAGAEPTRPDDGEILEAAVRGISELNERYEAEHGVRPFHLLVRARDVQRVRGRVDGLGAQARRARSSSCARCAGDRTPPSRRSWATSAFRRACAFVITLDADTVLPRDGARKLVSTIAHPLNRARWRPGDAARRGGLRARAAARGHDARGVAPQPVRVAVLRADRHRPVRGRGLRHLPGRLRRGLVHRQGHLRGRRVRGRARGPLPRELAALPRPRRGLVPAHRARERRRGARRLPRELPRRRLAAAPLGARRLADAAVAPRTRAGRRRARASANPLSTLHRWKIVDNLRRSLVAPSMLALFVARLAGCCPEAGASWPLAHGARAAVPGVLLARRLDGLPAALGELRGDRAVDAARLRDRLVARRAHARGAAASGVAHGRRDRPRAVAHGRLAQAPARVGDRRRRREARRHARAARSCARWRRPRRSRRSRSSPACSRPWQARPASRPLARARRGCARAAARGGVARRRGLRVVGLAAGARRRGRAARRRGDARAAPRRPQDVAVLRHVRRRARAPPGARQLPGGSGRGRRVAHLAHQHRPAAARRTSTPTTSATSTVRRAQLDACRSDARPRWPDSSGSAVTSTTGTTSRRSSRCARPTSPPSTRATSPGTCSCCASRCSRPPSRRCSARSCSRALATPCGSRSRTSSPSRPRSRRRSTRTRLREALDALGRVARHRRVPDRPRRVGVLLERFSALADQLESAMGDALAASRRAAPRPSVPIDARRAPRGCSVADAVAAIRAPRDAARRATRRGRARRRRARRRCATTPRSSRCSRACPASSVSPRVSAEALAALDGLAAETTAPPARGPPPSPRASATAAPARRRAARAAAPLHRHRARDVGAHRLLDAVRPAPPALLDRLQPQRGPPRPQLLRPARERVPPRELPRDREGRRRPGALVPPRPLAHARCARAARSSRGARRCSST